ncbi:Protein N-acetyltransferase, RimJ/RimL family [Palleronia marisminoris]|uniref:Putative ribosomal N-acetyltransferase YdaF n=1 Tax=Palleronia marisminoris TaxID=315423 RepID=A0A1Y5R6B4_9RHOB|nr:GNAT family protein [Palleronia marisminoris]SFG05131.1 Protein N-acetyltransferase, RimJ/RimL family [Palleronia marisminoris]SLN10199.1 Putative ribosomal N-acetyltransferase YdaF [Palleronia marisminoris]
MRDIAYLTTARLVLRPLYHDDAEAIVAGVGNYDVAKWLAVVPFPYDHGDAEAFLTSSAAEPRRAWAICDADGLCGVISAQDELGYWLARPVWGRGYGREAAEAARDAAFADPTRKQLSVSHMVGNHRSERLIRSLGFRPVGTTRRRFRALGQDADTALYEMTRADWRRLRRTEQQGRATT